MRIAGARSGAGFALACALAVSVLLPDAAASDETGRQDIAAPLRMVNLNPFHLLYGVPASAGARVMPAGSWELVASLDMASHLRAGGAGEERVLIEGETWRQGLPHATGVSVPANRGEGFALSVALTCDDDD